jgi:hypothetical protein
MLAVERNAADPWHSEEARADDRPLVAPPVVLRERIDERTAVSLAAPKV